MDPIILLRYPHLNTDSLNLGTFYDPLVQYAKSEDAVQAFEYLDALVQWTTKRNPGMEYPEAHKIVTVNLDYYCQYQSAEIASKVKDTYNLGQGFRTPEGKTDIPILELDSETAFKTGVAMGIRNRFKKDGTKKT